MSFNRAFLMLTLVLTSCATYIAPIPTPANLPTATVAPSATPTETPTLTPTPDLFVSAERIQYDANKDIWVSFEGTTNNGNLAYFVFRGTEGQELRLYVQYKPLWDGGLISETRIFDKNGGLINSEPVSDSGGWEGKLPSTQDYVIISTPVDNRKTDFVLQLATVPPRQESGYFIYRDERNWI